MSALEEIQKITNFNPSAEQLAILEHKGGMRILACAGAGKTSVLTYLLAKRIMENEITNVKKVLVTTYSVAGREELEIRINGLLAQLGIQTKLEIRTLHSSYMYMLKQVGSVGQIITNAQRTKLITEGMKLAKVSIDEDTTQKIDSLLSYQINNMMTSETLFKESIVLDIEINLFQYQQISSYYTKKKNELRVIDFDDLQLITWQKLVKDKDTRTLWRNIWSDFYIDEFQDVSKIQFEILKMLLQDPNKLVVIGDDDQAIYKWRGADPSIIQNICGYYDIDSFTLTTNYRCPNVIVNHAAMSIKNNSQRYEKTMQAFQQGGKLTILPMENNIYTMSKKAYEYIEELLQKGVAPHDIAILCRNNAHGLIIESMLDHKGKQARASKDMRFGSNTKAKEFKIALEICQNTYSHIYALQLWKYIQFLPFECAKAISNIMYDNGCSIKMALKAICSNIINKQYQDDTRIIPWVDGKYSILEYKLNARAAESLQNFYEILMKENAKERANDILDCYINTTIGFIYKSEDMQRNIIGLADYICDLLETETVTDVIGMFNQAENHALAQIESSRNCITISTMHGAKGKEWPYVIILGDDNLSVPGFQKISEMIKNNIPREEISDYIEQERRLHYVAMTRAKVELQLYVPQKKPSVFLLEALGILEKYDSINSHVFNIAKDGFYSQDLLAKFTSESQKYN